eukprot:m.134294 g.134294  ORF g.134294 m.134294 type:complete len:446 (-) comp14691_c0_seq1:1174-2511(-)
MERLIGNSSSYKEEHHQPHSSAERRDPDPKWLEDIEAEIRQLKLENSLLRSRVEQLEDAINKPSRSERKDTINEALHYIKEKASRKRKNTRPLSVLKKSWALNTTFCPTVVKRLVGHTDGVWDVSCYNDGSRNFIGTASADRTARIWADGKLLHVYQGHAGSVNSVQIHPTVDHAGTPLVCTGSGDCTAHLWVFSEDRQTQPDSSDDEKFHDAQADASSLPAETPNKSVSETKMIFEGHKGPVSSVHWVTKTGEKLVTGSWDGTAALWDTERSGLLYKLSGHEGRVTHVAAHDTKPLLITCATDAYRVWDYRQQPPSEIFQDHRADSITSGLFAEGDKIVVGSDRVVKVWDLRHAHSPFAVVRLNTGANKISMSSRGILAIPLDTRYIQLHALNGDRICRFPRDEGHQKMVTSTAWANEQTVVTSGFDGKVLEWSIQLGGGGNPS